MISSVVDAFAAYVFFLLCLFPASRLETQNTQVPACISRCPQTLAAFLTCIVMDGWSHPACIPGLQAGNELFFMTQIWWSCDAFAEATLWWDRCFRDVINWPCLERSDSITKSVIESHYLPEFWCIRRWMCHSLHMFTSLDLRFFWIWYILGLSLVLTLLWYFNDNSILLILFIVEG